MALPLALIAAPLAMRPPPPPATPNSVTLTVLTPHNQMTCGEFGRRFQQWAAKELNTTVVYDWRRIGGTGDIVRFMDDQYLARFRKAHPEFSGDATRAITDASLDDPVKGDSEAKRARQAFLASDTSIDVDLFWGGGEVPHRGVAAKGYLIDAKLIASEPTWFRDDVIPQTLAGETIYDKKGRYYGACLSSFGICANPDSAAALGIPLPRSWSDLGDPRLRGALTVADPTRSAAVVTAMERIIQQQMAETVAGGGDERTALALGWERGLTMIKRIAANAAYVTDGASQAVREVARGSVAAAMCIDFHARAEAEWSASQSGGRARVVYVTPPAGSSYSADPIALLRGAPQRAVAVAFIRFVLSPEGQRLWNYRMGEPGGPTTFSMRRLPVRRDVYSAADRAHMSDPGEDPFAAAEAFTYRGAWTGPYYDLIKFAVKALALDPNVELADAWRAIAAAGGPDRVPEAMREFAWLPDECAYANAKRGRELVTSEALQKLPVLRAWTTEAQAHYRAAERLARAGR